jgi:Tfp pilus assembly protein FimT
MITLPSIFALQSGMRTAAGARFVASSFQAARWKSVARSRGHGMFFDHDARGWYWFEVQDGNGNGLRTAEVRNGTDRTVTGPHRLEHRIQGVTFGFPTIGAIPKIPPRRGAITNMSDPIQFGRSNLIGFSPDGSSSSGTIYVTNGRDELYAVVLFGPTTRIRVWRYERRSGLWRL